MTLLLRLSILTCLLYVWWGVGMSELQELNK